MQAQEKIRNANILLITMSSLSAEIAKNLVLAGIHSLTILDHAIVTEADLGAQFFLTTDDIGKNRAAASAPNIRKLNPRVNVIVDESDIQTKKAPLVKDFDLVIATGLTAGPLAMLNTAARLHGKPFYAANVHGFYGFIFSDLIQHEYIVEREKGNMPTVLQAESRTRSIIEVKEKRENGKNIELVKKRELYSTWMLASDGASLPDEFLKSRRRLKNVTPILSCLRALWEYQSKRQTDAGPETIDDLKLFTTLATQKHKALGLPDETLKSDVLRKFIQNVNSQIAPVSAMLGGQLAQDVINVLGGRQQPIQNFVIMDGEQMEAPVYAMHPPGDLGQDMFPETDKAIARRLSQQMPEAISI